MGNLGFVVVSLLSASVSFAQSAPTAASGEPQKLEKIVVTGSYIRRTVDEGAPSPVSTVDNTKAQEAGSYSAGGMMRDNAVVSSGGSSNVSFHGQSSANNLVLLNGLRLPKPAGGDSADIDFIPASAIERVEILKDGASALYGSEALAGVVNIITKKEYEGANVSIRRTQPEANIGQETNITATYGKGFKKGNILAVFQYRANEPYMYRDTEYGMTDVKRRGSLASFPGNLQNGSNTYGAADCPPGQTDSRGACRYNFYDTLQLANERNYYTGLVSAGFDLTEKLRLEAGLLYTLRESKSLNTPKIINFEDLSNGGGKDYSIPGSKANDWSSLLNGNPTFGPTDKTKLSYSANEELGIEASKSVLQNVMAQVKLGSQSEKFDWDVAVGYGISDYRNDVYGGNANKDIMHENLLNGTWRPFNASGDKGTLANARLTTWDSNFADVLNSRAIASGRAVDWGQKSVYAAFGVEHQLQSYRFRADSLSLQDIPLTGLFSNQNGNRDVSSVFLELTQNPIPALQLQLAGRFDKYSDFGSTTNPKVAAAYKFSEKFMGRVSYGTGFKAPDLRALYQGAATRPMRFRDEVICKGSGPNFGQNSPNCNNLFNTTTRGNPNLDPELGQHINLGVQFRPKKNWQINIDHWRAHGEDALEIVNLNRMTYAEQLLGPSALQNLGVTIDRNPDPANPYIRSVSIPYRTNSGRYNISGIDMDLKYNTQLNPFGTGTMNVTFKFDHSHLLSRGSQPFSFYGYEKNLDLNWKNISSINVSKGSHLYSLRARTFSAQDKDESRTNMRGGYGSIPMYTEYDFHYEYYGAWEGVITFGIRNLLDKKYYTEYNRGDTGFLLPASDTLLGRTFYVGYSQDF